MKAIAEGFGLAWPSFIAQILIFLIVYLVLKKYAFGPILEMLLERKRRIAEAEENLEKVQADLEGAEDKARKILAEANADAERLINEAKESAGAAGDKELAKASAEAKRIRSKAHEEAALERDRMMGELKGEFGRLVVDATTKVTGNVLTDSDQQRINKEAAGQIGV